jgi:hypothetical protein
VENTLHTQHQGSSSAAVCIAVVAAAAVQAKACEVDQQFFLKHRPSSTPAVAA